MTASHCLRRCLLAFAALSLAACSVVPRPTDESYAPQYNQPGKDVVWWPTPETLVDKMLDMAEVTPDDYLIDLGSGDGRTVVAAAKRGARALGIEFNSDMVALSRRNIVNAMVGDKATIVQGDIFRSDLTQATVISMFLLPQLNLRLRPSLLSLKAGIRITSNSFDMDDWEPDATAKLGCAQYCTAYLWIVPAQVQGKWQSAQGELELRQKFQKLNGTLREGNLALPLSDGKLHGESISFAVSGAEYRGKVHQGTIEGSVTAGGVTSAWRAKRQD